MTGLSLGAIPFNEDQFQIATF